MEQTEQQVSCEYIRSLTLVSYYQPPQASLFEQLLLNMQANRKVMPKLFRTHDSAPTRPSLDRRELIERLIVPNAIVLARVASVRTSERNPRKMHEIKVHITGVRAVAHSGKHLY